MLFLLGVVAWAAELRPVKVSRGQRLSLAAAPALLAILLQPGPLAAGVMAAAALAAELRRGGSRRASLFNAAGVGLAALAASLVAAPPAAPGAAWLARAALAAATFSLVSLALPALAAAWQLDRRFGAVMAGAVVGTWPLLLAGAALALATAALLLSAPAAAWLPLAFLPLVYRMDRSLEAELATRRRLDRVLEGQRQFLTDVSHNVGNPLATIQTNLSLLGSARLSRAQALALADAAGESTRLGELFGRLRILAETDEERPLQRRRVELAEMARELVRLYSGAADRRGVHLRAGGDEGLAVDADEDLLRQAAANLVENAIRHSPPGETIWVRAQADHARAVLEVVDRGPGIEPHMVPAIFERFNHGPKGGSGLGLAIARSVVERHGGQIQVDSRPGQPTAFRIVLPPA